MAIFKHCVPLIYHILSRIFALSLNFGILKPKSQLGRHLLGGIMLNFFSLFIASILLSTSLSLHAAKIPEKNFCWNGLRTLSKINPDLKKEARDRHILNRTARAINTVGSTVSTLLGAGIGAYGAGLGFLLGGPVGALVGAGVGVLGGLAVKGATWIATSPLKGLGLLMRNPIRTQELFSFRQLYESVSPSEKQFLEQESPQWEQLKTLGGFELSKEHIHNVKTLHKGVQKYRKKLQRKLKRKTNETSKLSFKRIFQALEKLDTSESGTGNKLCRIPKDKDKIVFERISYRRLLKAITGMEPEEDTPTEAISSSSLNKSKYHSYDHEKSKRNLSSKK